MMQTEIVTVASITGGTISGQPGKAYPAQMNNPAGVVDTADATASLKVPNRELIELSARFSHAFLRWLDGAQGELPYPRLRVLEVLHCQGPAMMKDLADGVGISARNLTTLADGLEHEGLLRRVPHPTDRRATLLELTSSGVAAAESALAPRLAEIGRLFNLLSPTQQTQLARAMRTLSDGLD